MVNIGLLRAQIKSGLRNVRCLVVVALSLFIVGFQWWSIRHLGYRIHDHESTFLDEVQWYGVISFSFSVFSCIGWRQCISYGKAESSAGITGSSLKLWCCGAHIFMLGFSAGGVWRCASLSYQYYILRDSESTFVVH